MKVKIVSDLHLEFGVDFDPGEGDLLILAGDTVCAKNLGENPSASIHGKLYLKFFERASKQFGRVLMVMGNHEHYGCSVDKTYDRIVRWLPKNITLLNDHTVKIEDWIFVGSTLWTDCNNADPITFSQLNVGMSDFHICRKNNGEFKFRSEDAYNMHKISRQYIEHVAKENGPDSKIFVITHHAPHEKSVDEKYKYDHTMNGGYRSNLFDLIYDHPQIKYWVHGHMHNSSDYIVAETRVIANPRGYPNHQRFENLMFDPKLTIEI